MDSLYFTYNKQFIHGLDEYLSKDTVIDPKENIKKALEFFDQLKKAFPLAQFNLFGFSLGGIFAREVAMQNMDCINNLVLLDSPIRGLKDSFDTRIKTAILNKAIQGFVDEEYVTDYLFKIRKDEDYQKQLEERARTFISLGRNFTIFSSDLDPVAPQDSCLIDGPKSIVVSTGDINPFIAHGKILGDIRVVALIRELIGDNLYR